MKIIVVDNTVIITGANLSDIYFTYRQDRYMVLHDVPMLADSLHDIVSGSGHITSSSGSIQISPETAIAYRVNDPDISHRDELVNAVLSSEPETSKIYLSSPYLNLSPDIVTSLKKFEHVKIITGSMETNAFHNSKGLSKHIPVAYAIVQEDIPKEFGISEYSRPGWSFHPKGIWITRSGESMPRSTIIGSSNFGHRSSVRDLEISFHVQSEDEIIRHGMKMEWERIKKWSKSVPKGRRVKAGSILRYLVRKPLRTFL